jgi:hypothetical protein
MKKFTILLGSALLLAGAANAQSGPRTLSVAAPAGVGTAPGQAPTRGASTAPAATARPALGAAGTINNDSYVQQVGSNQMANVTQTGTGRNTADIDQSPSGGNQLAGNGGGNYASQVQRSVAGNAGDQNQANIRQHGATSTATQEQEGIRNQAAIQQGRNTGNLGLGVPSSNDYASQKQIGNDNKARVLQNTTVPYSNNSATQEQLGNANNAYASQQGQGHMATQKQAGTGGGTGNDNNASVSQAGANQYASQEQLGNGNKASVSQETLLSANNQAIQAQTGDNNRALVNQSTSNNYANQTQTGNGNYAETMQGGGGLNAGWSTITQQGNGSSAIVRQGAQ